MSGPRWYVLVHQLPREPLYLRAKIRSRLTRLGAVALKRSIYLLPREESLLGPLRRIADEAKEGGGAADVFDADIVGPRTNDDLEDLFRRERAGDYRALAARVRRWSADRRKRPAGVVRLRVARGRKRLEAVRRVDFFDAPGREEAEKALAELEASLEGLRSRAAARDPHADLVGRTWVTRRGIQVDRIASAWFIRRFIDPHARLRFIDPGSPNQRPGEITYDMVGGDFTHEGDRCSFETLILRTKTRDAALARVAEIVHEIDIKDGKYSCPETKGVQQVLAGMLMANPDDESRLDRGFATFDDLYQSFHRRLPAPEAGRTPREAHPPKGGRA